MNGKIILNPRVAFYTDFILDIRKIFSQIF